MFYTQELISGFIGSVKDIYQVDIASSHVTVSPTKKEFSGDYTIVLFPFIKQLKESPESIGEKIGNQLKAILPYVRSTNTIKGFLNIEFTPEFWLMSLAKMENEKEYGNSAPNGQRVMVEFSSPNTNKPLHLGHIRNILLGWSCSKILSANGFNVIRVQIINDRGIAICKSMLAWQLYGNNIDPQVSGIKGDHLVGDFYVLFEQKFQEEYLDWQRSEEGKKTFDTFKKPDQEEAEFFKGYKNQYFNSFSKLGVQSKEMLLRWEAGDPKTIELWKQMNGWVYEGFADTYDLLGVNFDKLYFESETYLLGKDLVQEGLKKEVFYQKDDSSVWIDLSDIGMDHKIVLRSDGTSVYITQDIGTARVRYEDYKMDRLIYTVADEQDYHFKVLFEIMKRLGEPYAQGLHHLSYGMVDLPTGKMKSREGTVVDADDLIAEVVNEARLAASERGEITGLTSAEQEEVIRKIGMAALKFFIIKVQPQKRMIFDPKESVDMQGQTGPYIQNAFVRIKSILRKNEASVIESGMPAVVLEQESGLIKLMLEYTDVVQEAGRQYDPSGIANYCYALAKEFHRFYHDVRILNAETIEEKQFRLRICKMVAQVLQHGMDLLGIEMPEKM